MLVSSLVWALIAALAWALVATASLRRRSSDDRAPRHRGHAARARSRPSALVIATLIVGSVLVGPIPGTFADAPSDATRASVTTPVAPSGPILGPPLRADPPATSNRLIRPGLSLRAPSVPVPLELRIPALGVRAAVLGVGITATGAMDAPMGPRRAPVWQTAFWYRGGGIPGENGTATIAGHSSGSRGRPSIFAHLDDLRRGDTIVTRDTRTGLDTRFEVTATRSYSLREVATRSVLTRMYGTGPVSGLDPQPARDGLSHLTLITCAGDFVGGTHDRRFVVYATHVVDGDRSSDAPSPRWWS